MKRTASFLKNKINRFWISVCTFGVLFAMIAYMAYTGADIEFADSNIRNTMQYLKNQCVSYDEILSADKVKSLIRLSEQATEVVRDIKNDDTRVEYEYLKDYASEQRLAGIIITDENINPVCEYSDDRISFGDLKDLLVSKSVRDSIDYPTKIFMERINVSGQHFDFAVLAREDTKGLVCCYRYQDNEINFINQSSLENLLSGYALDTNGVMAIAKDGVIRGTNIDSLKYKKVSDNEILSQLDNANAFEGVRKIDVDDGYFGNVTMYRDYKLYVYYPQSEVFSRRNRFTLYILFGYALIVMGYYMLKTKSEKKSILAANAAKTDFLRRMSHDVRTPINIIFGMLRIGNKYPNDLEKQRYCREKAGEASALLLDIMNGILTANKLDSDNFEIEKAPFDIEKAINEVCSIVEIQASEKNIKFSVEKGELKHNYIMGSSIFLRQIFLNIFGNAVKYTPNNGEINVSYRELNSSEPNRGVFEFSCRDNGIGMSEDFQKHMFEEFAQETREIKVSEGGVGLGLSIVKKLVDKMGGSVEVKSAVNRGSVFTVRIPTEFCDEPIAKNIQNVEYADGNDSAENLADKKVNVLVAEDNALNMEIAEFMLSEKGAAVTKAINGKEAVDIWKNSKEGTFELILLDLMMPVMTGIDAAKAIRNSDRSDAKTVPIAAMTANNLYEDITECEKVGMNGLLTKPLKADCLTELINNLKKQNFIPNKFYTDIGECR